MNTPLTELQTLQQLDRMSRDRAMQTARDLKAQQVPAYFVRAAVEMARGCNRALVRRSRGTPSISRRVDDQSVPDREPRYRSWEERLADEAGSRTRGPL